MEKTIDKAKELMSKISTLREIKGKEKETYELIEDAKKFAKSEKDYELLIKLHWEESLVAQHEVMNEISKDKKNEEITNKALLKMEKAALEAHKIIEQHNLNKMLGTSYRFLGNIYRYKKDYETAEKYFIEALVEYQKTEDKGTLEIRGFMAYCLIQNKELHNGIKLALETFDSFDTSEKGIALKEKDYFTWAVWKSGIIPRIIEALKDTNNLNDINKEIDKNKLLEYLDKSEDILKNPQGKITWGDSAFQLRIDEIKKARELLENN
jgi:tetratricopeptide (TPR) repeat protein